MFVRMGVYLRARACKNVMLHVCVCGRLYVRSCAYIVCMCELERVGIFMYVFIRMYVCTCRGDFGCMCACEIVCVYVVRKNARI